MDMIAAFFPFLLSCKKNGYLCIIYCIAFNDNKKDSHNSKISCVFYCYERKTLFVTYIPVAADSR